MNWLQNELHAGFRRVGSQNNNYIYSSVARFIPIDAWHSDWNCPKKSNGTRLITCSASGSERARGLRESTRVNRWIFMHVMRQKQHQAWRTNRAVWTRNTCGFGIYAPTRASTRSLHDCMFASRQVSVTIGKCLKAVSINCINEYSLTRKRACNWTCRRLAISDDLEMRGAKACVVYVTVSNLSSNSKCQHGKKPLFDRFLAFQASKV